MDFCTVALAATRVWTICTGASHVICGGSWARPEHTALVACLDAASGARRWTVDPKVGRYIVTALRPDGGVAFCGGENGMVAALSPETGDVLWHSSSSVEEVWGLELAHGLVICSGGWSEQVHANMKGQRPTGEVHRKDY
eukprot:s3705_g8.t1